MKKSLTIALTTIIAASSFALAAPMDKGHGKCEMMPKDKIFKELGLSDAQKEKLKEIRQANFKNHQGMMTKSPLSNYFDKNGFDKSKFISDKTANSKMMIEGMANSIDASYNVLTPTQKVKFVTLLKEKEQKRAAMMQKHFGKKGDMPPPPMH